MLELSGGYWQACVLHTGVRLGLFDAIESREATAEELSQELHCSLRGLEMLLDALVAMGLVKKKDKTFSNSGAASRFLVESSEDYVGYMILHHWHLMKGWAELVEAVKRGSPIRKGPRDEEERKHFLLGMHNTARGVAPKVADAVDLGTRQRLLDLGGGPGTYAIFFCLKNPHLRATVFDLPTTEPYTTQTIARYGLLDRIKFFGGDYLVQDLPGGHDVVWVSHIIHSLGPEEVLKLMKKAASILPPGGLMLIHDFFVEKDRAGPLFPVLFSLNMLINTEKGRSYTESEVMEMLYAIGANEAIRLPFQGPNHSGIISARF